jgi:hypothetical protein
MDELSLRALLERATSPEPPIGQIVDKSLRTGRRLRRRRATAAAVISAAAVVVVSAVPALTAGAGRTAGPNRTSGVGRTADAGQKVSKQAPATVVAPHATARTAYVATTQNAVVPINLATNTVGTAIRVPEVIDDPFVIQAAASPDGRTVYEVGMPGAGPTTVTPIDTATKTAGPPITIGNAEPQYFAVAPNGQTAYLSAPEGLFRISTTTNTASQAPDCSRFGCEAIAFSPSSKTLCVISGGRRTVIVMRTPSSRVVTHIGLPPPDNTAPRQIAITPNGKIAYVVDSMAGGKPGANSVVPINLVTDQPLTPIKIWASGFADDIVISPDGSTAYVLSSRGVTAIDTATNQAKPTIELPESAGYAYFMALAPDGKTLYVLTPRGVVPIRTGSGTVLPTIGVPKLCSSTPIAITPDGSTVYVGACITRSHILDGIKVQKIVGGGVVPISTATNTVGRFINLGGPPVAITLAR